MAVNDLDDWEEDQDLSAAHFQQSVRAIRAGLPIYAGKGIRVYSSPTGGTAIAARIEPPPGLETALLLIRDARDIIGDDTLLSVRKYEARIFDRASFDADAFLNNDASVPPDAIAIDWQQNWALSGQGPLYQSDGTAVDRIPLNGAVMPGIIDGSEQVTIGETTRSLPVFAIHTAMLKVYFNASTLWLEGVYVRFPRGGVGVTAAQNIRLVQFGPCTTP